MTKGVQIALEIAIKEGHCEDYAGFVSLANSGHSANLLHRLEDTRSSRDINILLQTSADSDIQRYNRLLSIRSRESGAFLSNLDNSEKNSTYFRNAFCYRYGLPVLNFMEAKTCPWCLKENALDRHGHHVFSCKTLLGKQRTSYLHNPVRDAVCIMLTEVARIKSSPIHPVSIGREVTGLLSAKPGCTATQRPADVYFAHDAAKLNAVDEAGSRVTVTSTAIDVKTVIPDLNRKVPDKGVVRSNDPPHPHDLPHLLNAENKAIDGQAYGGNLGGYLASIGIGFGAAAFDTFGAAGPTFNAISNSATFAATSKASNSHISRSNAMLYSQEANFSFDSGRNDKIPSPPYIPPDIMGLFSNAPRLAEMDGKKMSLPWYQGNYLNKQEQFISTVISQGVGQCLAEVAALVNGARLSLSVTQVDSRNAVIRRADTTDRFTNDATFFFNTARILYGREEIGDEHCAGLPLENDDGHAASSREDHRDASDMREKSETPDDDSSETPRGMIDN